MGWQEIRQAKPLSGKNVQILVAAYVVRISLQNNQILFWLNTKTIEAATRPFGILLHSENTEQGSPF